MTAMVLSFLCGSAAGAAALHLFVYRKFFLHALSWRVQLAACKRRGVKPTFTTWHRALLTGLSRCGSGWRDALVVVRPETVLRWRREMIHKYWT